MTDKIMRIEGGKYNAREVDEDVVKAIKNMLEKAEAGVLVGFTGAYLDNTGSTYRIVVGQTSLGLLGALDLARQAFMDQWRDE